MALAPVDVVEWLLQEVLLQPASSAAHPWSHRYDPAVVRAVLSCSLQAVKCQWLNAEQPGRLAPALQQALEASSAAAALRSLAPLEEDRLPGRHWRLLQPAPGGAPGALPHTGSKRRRDEPAPVVVDRVQRHQKAFLTVAARLGWAVLQMEGPVEDILQAGPTISAEAACFPTSLSSPDFLVDVVYGADDGLVSDLRLEHSYAEGCTETLSPESVEDQTRMLLAALRQAAPNTPPGDLLAGGTAEHCLRRAMAEFEAVLRRIGAVRRLLETLPAELQKQYSAAEKSITLMEGELRHDPSLEVRKGWAPGLHLRPASSPGPLLALTADPPPAFWSRCLPALPGPPPAPRVGVALRVPGGCLFPSATVRHLARLLEGAPVAPTAVPWAALALQGEGQPPGVDFAAGFLGRLGPPPSARRVGAALEGGHPYHRGLTLRVDDSLEDPKGSLCLHPQATLVQRVPVQAAWQARLAAAFCTAQAAVNALLRSCGSSSPNPAVAAEPRRWVAEVRLAACFRLRLSLSDQERVCFVADITVKEGPWDVDFRDKSGATHLPEAAWRRCVACVAESLAVYHSVPRAVGDLLEAVASAAPQAQPSATLGQALVTH